MEIYHNTMLIFVRTNYTVLFPKVGKMNRKTYQHIPSIPSRGAVKIESRQNFETITSDRLYRERSSPGYS
jgi:hypothetical protein